MQFYPLFFASILCFPLVTDCFTMVAGAILGLALNGKNIVVPYRRRTLSFISFCQSWVGEEEVATEERERTEGRRTSITRGW